MSNTNIFKIKIFQPSFLQPRLHSNIGNQTPAIKRQIKPTSINLNESQSIINFTPIQSNTYLNININNNNNNNNNTNLFTTNNTSNKSKQIDNTFQSYRSSSSFRSHRAVKKTINLQNIKIQSIKKQIKQRPQSAMLKKSRKRSWEYYKNKLPLFMIDDLLFMKNQKLLQEGIVPIEQCVAFSKKKAIFVRIVKGKQDVQWEPISNQYIVKIFGRISINDQMYFIVQNFNKTSIRDIINSFGPCKQSLVKRQIRSLVCGVIHCHNRGIVHNRINPDNIYMNKQGNYLIDIVKSTLSGPTQIEKQKYFNYFSPQLLTQGISSESCDVWAIGCLTLQILTGRIKTSVFHPYHQWNDASPSSSSPTLKHLKQQSKKYIRNQNQKNQILSQEINKKAEQDLSKSAKSFIAACLKINYRTRPELSILIDHDFLRIST